MSSVGDEHISFSKRSFVEKKFQTDQRYKLWVDKLAEKLYNVDKESFSFACRQYMAMFRGQLKTRMNFINEDDTKRYASESEAVSQFVEEKWTQYATE